eukprot:g4052.t1
MSMSSSVKEKVLKVVTISNQPMGVLFVGGADNRGALVKKTHPVHGTAGQLERAGVKTPMQLVSINGINVLDMVFEEIILLLRSRAKESKELIFSEELGEKSLEKKTLLRFSSFRNKQRKQSRASSSLRRALSFSASKDPYWIYKHAFEEDVLQEVKEKVEKRPIEAAKRIQSIFRGRSSRRNFYKKRGISVYKKRSEIDQCTFEFKDFNITFTTKTLGLRITEYKDTENGNIRPHELRGFTVGLKLVISEPQRSSTKNLLRDGDLLIKSNLESFEFMSFEDVRQHLQTSPRPLTLTFRRWTRVRLSQRAREETRRSVAAVGVSQQSSASATAVVDNSRDDIVIDDRSDRGVGTEDATVRHRSATRIQALVRGRRSRSQRSIDASDGTSTPIEGTSNKRVWRDENSDGTAGLTNSRSEMTTTHGQDKVMYDMADAMDELHASSRATTAVDDENIRAVASDSATTDHSDIHSSYVVADDESFDDKMQENDLATSSAGVPAFDGWYDKSSAEVTSEPEIASSSAMIPLDTFPEAYSRTKDARRGDASDKLSVDVDGKTYPIRESKCTLTFQADPIMLSLSEASKKLTRKTQNKLILNAFLKWHGDRDRPVPRPLDRPARGKAMLSAATGLW